MAFNSVVYTGKSNRLLSGNLWQTCPVSELLCLEQDGFFYFYDFLNVPDLSADADDDEFASYIDTGNTIKQLATEKGGVLEILTDTTDNDEAWISTGGNAGTLAGISETAGNAYNTRLYFECRFKVQNIANSQKNIYLGFCEEARAAADTITDAGVLGDFDFVGFNQPEADGDGLDAVWQKQGQALQVKIADMATLAADTFVKVGLRYDPSSTGSSSSKRLVFYKDNVEQSTYGTSANLTAATFPAGEELALLAGLKNGTGAAHKLQIDWWAVSQLY